MLTRLALLLVHFKGRTTGHPTVTLWQSQCCDSHSVHRFELQLHLWSLLCSFHTLNFNSCSPLDNKARFGARSGACEASFETPSESESDCRCYPAQTFKNLMPTCRRGGSYASCIPCCLCGGLETWKHFSQLPAYFRGKKHAGKSDDSFRFIAGDGKRTLCESNR